MADVIEQGAGLTPRRRRFAVDVKPSFVLEAMLVLWSALGADDKVGTHELGKRWFESIRKRIPAEIVEQMEAFGGDSGHIWHGFVVWAAAAPDPSDIEATLEWMESSDYAPFKRAVIEEMCWDYAPDTLIAAMDGDLEAIDACLQRSKEADRDAIERWMTFPVADMPIRVVEVLRYVIDEVLVDDAKAWGDAQRHSASIVESLARVLEPAELIERVTNGIDYEIPLGIVRLMLIPSISLRPWAMAHEVGDTVYVFYPIADEHMEADPGAPPQWLVRYHKALGDERRLRMLRRLADGPARLTELADEVGLAKSTVFHHIGVLRAAGLIRVHLAGKSDAGSPVYTLRPGVFRTASETIDAYLNGPQEQTGDFQ